MLEPSSVRSRTRPLGEAAWLPGRESAGDTSRAAGRPRRAHLLTIALEDYYQTFPELIEHAHWYRFENRIEQSTLRTLDLLDECGLKATFFTLGWTAERLPELIGEVVRRGHEIATKGYNHRAVRDMTSVDEFRDDLARARDATEGASGTRLVGYRAPGWLDAEHLWALRALAEEGFAYDSSVKPLLGAFAGEPWRRFAHANRFGERTLWEFPVSSIGFPRMLFPIGAGNYFRQLPPALMNQAVAYWDRTYDAPFVMYFHTWELDPDQPQITAAPLLKRVRVYRNLDRVPATLRQYFSRYAFTGVARHMGIEPEPPRIHQDPRPRAAATGPGRRGIAAVPRESAQPRTRVTLVVPCYNEETTLPYLANTLESVSAFLAGDYEPDFVFVDDCSTDRTLESLQRIFGGRADCTVVHHATNQGAARAILTGIRHARAEIVASIDCDCTYDPHDLLQMIPLLTDGVDLVTGSPYHRGGTVHNVPAWRLALSKMASALYRLVLRQKLGTYTSFFRVHRRSAVLNVRLDRGGYLGIAEMIGRLDLAGSSIVEYPTTLNVRMLGHSKMKVVRTILGHLGLIAEFAVLRLRRAGRRHAAADRALAPEHSR